MKTEDQRIAIAEACPELFKPHQTYRDGRLVTILIRAGEPVSGDEIDPLTDLNAMHEAEKMLNFEQKMIYASKLWDLFCVGDAGYDFFLLHCTAAQRAEAFLKTLNLWKD